MQKEYRSIKEVVGPLMLVEGVEGVKYDELVEIEQADGEIRLGKVLEVNGSNALVQLLRQVRVLKYPLPRLDLSDMASSFRFPKICWAEYSTVWADLPTEARRL